MAQGALQHTGAQQHHDRRLGGAHGTVHGQRVGNHGARQRGTKPAQRHEGSAQALSGRSLLQGGEILRIQIVVGAFGGVRHTVGAQILGGGEHTGAQTQHVRGGLAGQCLRTGVSTKHGPGGHKGAHQHRRQHGNQGLRQDARGRHQRGNHDQQVRSRRNNHTRNTVAKLVNTAHEALQQGIAA